MAVGEITSVLPSLTTHVCFQKYIYVFLFKSSCFPTKPTCLCQNRQQFLLSFLGSLLVFGWPHPGPSSHGIAEAVALLATGTGRQGLLRAFPCLCRASALALRGARRRG